MKLFRLFNIEYPPQLIFSEQKKDSNGINFVSSSGKNNGVVSRVKQDKKNKLFKKGSITVPLKGSVLIAFIQPENFYIAHQIAVLTPIKEMTLSKKAYYCLCIRHNAFKYSFGRQADKTLREIELPARIPNFIETATLDKIKTMIINTVEKSFT